VLQTITRVTRAGMTVFLGVIIMSSGFKKLAEIEAKLAQGQKTLSQLPSNNQGINWGMFMLFRKFIVRKNEYGLLFKDGDFERFLAPGVYRFFDA